MTRWQRPLLVFSIALNVAFLSLAATHGVRNRDSGLGTNADADADSSATSNTNPPDDTAGGSPHDTHGMRFEPSSHHFPMLQRWHEQRHHMVARALDLDAAQQTAWDANFARFAPALPDLHFRVMAARAAYRSALLRGDASAVRSAATDVSHAQARIDSVCAEAMAGETSLLGPDQRARYVRWMFRGGPGRGGAPFMMAPFGTGPRPGEPPHASEPHRSGEPPPIH
jgi:hypothetical protein